jgi:hypothetical protein
MFRIDDPTAAAALPTPEAAGTPGYFTEGNPGVTPPTLVRASFLNMLQEEFIAVCVAAGITPSKTTYNQLLTALRSAGVFQTQSAGDNTTKAATTAFVQAIFTQFTGARSMVAPGYRAFPAFPGDPTPLILQWGSVTGSTSADVTVTYPIAFPSTAFCRVGTGRVGGTSAASFACIGTDSLTTLNIGAWTNGGARVGLVVDWLAIGK